MDEKTIVEGLLARDEDITRAFFYGDGDISCKGVLLNVLRRIYRRQTPDYDEAVSEFYLHMMKDDCRRLRMYDPSLHRLYGYVRTCAVRFFLDRRDAAQRLGGGAPRDGGDDPRPEHIVEVGRGFPGMETLYAAAGRAAFAYEEARRDGRETIAMTLESMRDRRRAAVLRELMLEGAEPADLALRMGVRVSNLYNIKRRALLDFRETALRLSEECHNPRPRD